MDEEVLIELGQVFHVTNTDSLFGAGTPIGYTCPGEGCPACAERKTCTVLVLSVDKETGTITAKI